MSEVATIERQVEVLNKAADLLETEGWTKGAFINDKSGHMCALGACRKAIAGDVWKLSKAELRLVDDITQKLSDEASKGGHRQHIVTYNDRQRDKRKVIRLMRRVARQLNSGTFKP